MKLPFNNHQDVSNKSIWGRLDAVSSVVLIVPMMNSIAGKHDSYELIFCSGFCTILYAISFISNRKKTVSQTCPIWYFAVLLTLALSMALFPSFTRQIVLGAIIIFAVLQIALSVINVRTLGQKSEKEFRQSQAQIWFIGMITFLLASSAVYQWMLG